MRVSCSNRPFRAWPLRKKACSAITPRKTQGRLHCTQLSPHYRFLPQVVKKLYLLGSPRKQGQRPHAIADRPTTLTSSISPRLGVSSQHQKLHRCALKRIFSPVFETVVPTRILHHQKRLYNKARCLSIYIRKLLMRSQFIAFSYRRLPAYILLIWRNGQRQKHLCFL